MQIATMIIISLIIIIICTMWGAHKGFLRMLIPFCSLFLAIVIAKYSVNPVTDLLIRNTSIEDSISDYYHSSIPSFDNVKTSSDERKAINDSTLPTFIKQSLIDNNNSITYAKLKVNDFNDYVGAYLSRFVTKIIAFVGLIIASFILLRLFCIILKLASKLPILHGISGFLGGLIGFVLGVILSLVAIVIIYMFFIKTSGVTSVDNSYIDTLLNYNIFLDWLR